MLDIAEESAVEILPPSNEDLIARVLGSCEGWCLGPVIEWLLTKESKVTEPEKFVELLMKQLVEAGAPINRVRTSFMTIHPQVAAFSYIWVKGQEDIEALAIPHEFRETSYYIGSPASVIFETGQSVRFKISEIDLSKEHDALSDVAATGATDYLGVPMFTTTDLIHPIFFSTDRPEGFNDDDIEKLTKLSAHIQAKWELLATQRLTMALLDTYVGKRTSQRVLNGQIKRGDGEEIEAALWFSDLRDFTALTENLPEKDLLELMNCYFELVNEAVTQNGGEVLRFIGDAMLIVFTAENAQTGCLYGASEGAFQASEQAFKRLDEITKERKKEGKPTFQFGVGLHEGKVTYGNVGAPDRLDFTVMGPAVNRTARLESKTKELGQNRLMSRQFADRLSRDIESHGFHHLKGVSEAQEICSVA